jgi:hypothetical protein
MDVTMEMQQLPRCPSEMGAWRRKMEAPPEAVRGRKPEQSGTGASCLRDAPPWQPSPLGWWRYQWRQCGDGRAVEPAQGAPDQGSTKAPIRFPCGAMLLGAGRMSSPAPVTNERQPGVPFSIHETSMCDLRIARWMSTVYAAVIPRGTRWVRERWHIGF